VHIAPAPNHRELSRGEQPRGPFAAGEMRSIYAESKVGFYAVIGRSVSGRVPRRVPNISRPRTKGVSSKTVPKRTSQTCKPTVSEPIGETPQKHSWPDGVLADRRSSYSIRQRQRRAGAAVSRDSQRSLYRSFPVKFFGVAKRYIWSDQKAAFRGREVDTAGDGLLATFDGPARAIRCACSVRERVRALGLQVRTGLHTGECELSGESVVGIAVHIGARVAALAEPDEVLVSSTVKDLVGGSGLKFGERGAHSLKGVPDEWRLFAVQ